MRALVIVVVMLVAGHSTCSSSPHRPPQPATGYVPYTLGIAVMGAIQGTSSGLDYSKPNACSTPAVALAKGAYAVSLYPIINGHTHQLAILVDHYEGPTSFQFPGNQNNANLLLFFDNSVPGDGATGSLVINPDALGGRVEMQGMTGSQGTLGLSATWSCPP